MGSFRIAAVLVALVVAGGSWATGAEPVWKAGVASVSITPEGPLWMAGYASRDKPSEGNASELYAKSLVLEDPAGTRVVFITLDLISVPKEMRDYVVQKLHERHNIAPESVVLNCSHTHCGPVIKTGSYILYQVTPEQRQAIETYVAGLHDKLVQVASKAIESLAPALVGYSHARAGFAMNRRLPSPTGFQNSPYPDGPVDHDVPVLRVDFPDGKLRAVLFGYACHNTTLGFFQFCGDYAGFAQQELEAAHPGVTALFLMGCGGDQNPYPRGTLELAQQHGRTLATAVEAALLSAATPVEPPLRAAFRETPLTFAPPPSREDMEKLKLSSNKYERRKGEVLLDQLDKQSLPTSYPLPVQAIGFGQSLTIVTLGGETVVDYSRRIKSEVTGGPVWVAGYSNDVFAYIPSRRVIQEGGYEGAGAMLYTSLPGPFTLDIEEAILNTVHELVGKVREK